MRDGRPSVYGGPHLQFLCPYLVIRLLRLTSQNYMISHWVAYYDVKYDELNEVFRVSQIYWRCKEHSGPDYSERATKSLKSKTPLTFFKNIFVIQ